MRPCFCRAGKNLKPYQGLKPFATTVVILGSPMAGKNLKPYQGLKLSHKSYWFYLSRCRKKPKTLSGIETLLPVFVRRMLILPEKT